MTELVKHRLTNFIKAVALHLEQMEIVVQYISDLKSTAVETSEEYFDLRRDLLYYQNELRSLLLFVKALDDARENLMELAGSLRSSELINMFRNRAEELAKNETGTNVDVMMSYVQLSPLLVSIIQEFQEKIEDFSKPSCDDTVRPLTPLNCSHKKNISKFAPAPIDPHELHQQLEDEIDQNREEDNGEEERDYKIVAMPYDDRYDDRYDNTHKRRVYRNNDQEKRRRDQKKKSFSKKHGKTLVVLDSPVPVKPTVLTTGEKQKLKTENKRHREDERKRIPVSHIEDPNTNDNNVQNFGVFTRHIVDPRFEETKDRKKSISAQRDSKHALYNETANLL